MRKSHFFTLLLAAALSLVAVLGLPACRQHSHNTARAEDDMAFVEVPWQWDRLATEEEKWERARLRYEQLALRRNLPVDEYLLRVLLSLTPESGELLRNYPQIVSRLPFREEHLFRLGGFVDSEDRAIWGGHRGGGLHVTYVADETDGELARGWLHVLTGRQFATRAEFDGWYENSREHLQWRPDLGQFVLEGEQRS